MMWNYALASMLCGATLVIHEGSAGYPSLKTLWDLVHDARVDHFGAGSFAFFRQDEVFKIDADSFAVLFKTREITHGRI